MLIELDRNSRAAVARLFTDYPYIHGSIAAMIVGGGSRCTVMIALF